MSTTGAKDGNNASNRANVSATITGIVIPPGATFFIRWLDFDASGSDDGLAVDDFSITPFTTPTLTINDVSGTEASGGAPSLVFDVTLSEFFGDVVTVDFSTMSGLAVEGSDYTKTTGKLTFDPAEGVRTKQLTVPIIDDCLIEGPETFTVTLMDAVNAAIVKASGTGTIFSDDLPGTLQFSAANYSVAENDGTALVTVTRVGGTGESVSVKYSTSNGTADSALDYTATAGTLVFACNEVSKTFAVPINSDNLPEPPETVNLMLSSPAGGAALGSVIAAVLTINDDDGPGFGAPGTPAPASAMVSDQKAGSILIFPIYDSSATRPAQENTRLNITNTDSSRPAYVHLFFVEGGGQVADSYVCLSASQTVSLLTSDVDPGENGYVVAVAVDGATGCPVNFNFLIGDEYIKLTSGHAANLGAEAFAALPGAPLPCDANAADVELPLDGVSYNEAPRVLAVDSVLSPADGNNQLLIIDRVGGDLRDRVSTIGEMIGLLFDDMENPHSFENSGGIQLRRTLGNDFPHTTPRLVNVIPAGHTGWLKLWTESDRGIIGAAINFNPNATSQTAAFNQGHNLHKLTLTTKAVFQIPVFPPHCPA
ncbi:MAG TPA: Calx-beta domain-containing protein [Blastocatellia bacterium]|nr:Calx-beta domain-containing protein [Blastocatellia bacterium]